MHSELEVRPDDHVRGSARATLTLLEYGDYQCPYCGLAFAAIQEAQRALGRELRFVFRNFPLTELHPYALPAAQVAEVADLQARFWPMHDALYTNQSELSPETFLLLARELGVDLKRFQRDLDGEVVLRRIERDLESADTLALQGTPSLFINGLAYRGPFTDGQLTRVLQQRLSSGDSLTS